MIKCRYDRENYTLTIEGHANFAPYGQDIVCAGISALEAALDSYFTGRADCIARIEPTTGYFVGNAEVLPTMDCIWGGIALISANYPNFCKCIISLDNPLDI